ncbi:MAG: hypothetical protein K5660_05665 [Paludibacteraceae bacterium]|nr:hypothetical protein [Paludibacteraceae bacterium]
MSSFFCSILLAVHSFALWCDLGPHWEALLSPRPYAEQNISAIGGAGATLGLGYRYEESGFLLQMGPELGYRYSLLRQSDFSDQFPMRDTEWEQMQMYFDFTSVREHHRQVQADLALLVGYESKYRIYLLAGPRFGYVFHSPTTVTSIVTTRGRYDEFIGIDGDGLFENMPDHFFDTQKRSVATRYRPVPKMSVSIEAGYRFEFPAQVRHTRFSLAVALFADYGLLFAGDNSTTLAPVTYPNDVIGGNFYPYANPFLYRGIESSAVSNILCGIKLTLLISASKSFPCFCL